YMPRDFDISHYSEIVKPTIVRGFDYTTLHCSDKQKPLADGADEFGVSPDTVRSPPLIPGTCDTDATFPADQVTSSAELDATAERFAVADHFLRGEYIPSRRGERRAKLEHDPEKWKPVVRKDHAQTKS